MYRLPAASTARLPAGEKSAVAAGTPSGDPNRPLPTAVLMMPCFTTRIFRSRLSAIYTFPAESTAIAVGIFKGTDVARPPSGLVPVEPLPANAMMIPMEALIIRTRLVSESAR